MPKSDVHEAKRRLLSSALLRCHPIFQFNDRAAQGAEFLLQASRCVRAANVSPSFPLYSALINESKLPVYMLGLS